MESKNLPATTYAKKNCHGKTIGVFTFRIPEIANQNVEISSTLKTFDMSRLIPTYGGNRSSVLFRSQTRRSPTPIN
jgi:hypothetical protein